MRARFSSFRIFRPMVHGVHYVWEIILKWFFFLSSFCEKTFLIRNSYIEKKFPEKIYQFPLSNTGRSLNRFVFWCLVVQTVVQIVVQTIQFSYIFSLKKKIEFVQRIEQIPSTDSMKSILKEASELRNRIKYGKENALTFSKKLNDWIG